MCNEVENLFERYNEAKKELEYHKNEAERLEKDVNEAKREVEYHKKEAERLEKEVEYLEREIHEMQDGFSKLADKVHDKTDEKDKRIEELEGMVKRYRRTVSYYNNAFTKLVNDKRELMEKVDKQAECLKEKDKQIEQLKNEIDSYKERLYVVEDITGTLALKEKVERIKDYRSFNDEIEELKEENESLKRQVDGWKGLARRSGKKSVEYYKKLEDKNKLIDYMRDKNDKIEKYVDKLNCDIARKDEQIEKLNKELAIARVGSQTRMFRAYTISRDEALKAINEAIKKLNEED